MELIVNNSVSVKSHADRVAEALQVLNTEHSVPRISSRQMAEKFNKEHKNVLRDIRELTAGLDGEFAQLNFEPKYIKALTPVFPRESRGTKTQFSPSCLHVVEIISGAGLGSLIKANSYTHATAFLKAAYRSPPAP